MRRASPEATMSLDYEDVVPKKRARKSSSREPDDAMYKSDKKFGGELWEVCPLDHTHYSKRKNMKDHIEECKRMCLKSPRKVECPFNPLHIINLMEVEQHVMTCPNRVTILNSLCDFEPKRETIEGVLMEPVNVLPEIPTHWDDEEHPETGYDPEDSTKFRAVLKQMPPRLSKTQKKAWRAKERQRWKWLTGETKEKPRDSPYPKPGDIKAVKEEVKTEAAVREEGTIMQSIIDGLTGANIADPRDDMLKRINAKLKILQMMEAKLKEEKMELQRQVEQYLASIAKPEENVATTNGDPRLASKNSGNSPDLRIPNADHTSRILPDIMTSAMIR